MLPLRQFLKSAQTHLGLKSRLKLLFETSCSHSQCSKPALSECYTAGVLPSTSFRTFQCEISRFCSRTWEVGDSDKPLTMSEAVSRVLAIPSVHGPVWQSFGYYKQHLLDESPIVGSKESVHLTAAALQCRITISKRLKFEEKLTFALGSKPDGSISGVFLSPKNCKDMKNLLLEADVNVLSRKQMELSHIPKIDWRCDSEIPLESQETRDCDIRVHKSLPKFYDLLKPRTVMRNSFSDIMSGSIHDTGDPIVKDKVSLRGLVRTGLRLLSGACYFPHPAKEVTGGEDAYFICPEKQVFGVADGVGGWADLGIDSGEYARQLMKQSLIAAREEPPGCVDAVRILEKAYLKTTCLGSSTACILALSNDSLQAVNLGDSGFLVVRDGQMIFKSPAQQHAFNSPFQLESAGRGDPISAAERFFVEVVAGDVIIAGTDGLFDNLYTADMASMVAHATCSGLSPDAMAHHIAFLARERAKDCLQQTPFSAAAQDAGYRFYGGKLDDITVIVSYVTDCKL